MSSLAETTQRFLEVTERRIENVEQSIKTLGMQMRASIKNLETQMGQVIDTVRRNEPGRFPSQLEQASVVTVLRSGRVLNKEKVDEQKQEGPRGSEDVSEKEARIEEEEVVVELAPKKTLAL